MNKDSKLLAEAYDEISKSEPVEETDSEKNKRVAIDFAEEMIDAYEYGRIDDKSLYNKALWVLKTIKGEDKSLTSP